MFNINILDNQLSIILFTFFILIILIKKKIVTKIFNFYVILYLLIN